MRQLLIEQHAHARSPLHAPLRAQSFETHEWAIMQEFGSDLANERLRGEVLDALSGRGAFRMFRSTTHRLGIEKDWYRYRDAAFERIAKDWLEANNVPYR
jgi:hypothetical protein